MLDHLLGCVVGARDAVVPSRGGCQSRACMRVHRVIEIIIHKQAGATRAQVVVVVPGKSLDTRSYDRRMVVRRSFQNMIVFSACMQVHAWLTAACKLHDDQLNTDGIDEPRALRMDSGLRHGPKSYLLYICMSIYISQ